jgi:Domain of unknown function (DUF222)
MAYVTEKIPEFIVDHEQMYYHRIMFDLATAVAEVERATDALARGLEPDEVLASDAMSLVKRLAKAERQLAGVKMRLAGRVAETPVWQHRGHRSAAHWLASESGTSVAEAVSTLQTAERAKALPATTDALRDGRLSRSQAAAVADAAEAVPEAEADLLGLAERESLKGLRDEAARRKQAGIDEQARHAAIHASRHVRFGTDADGAATMSVRATTSAMAEIRAGIAHFQSEVFERARRDGLREPFEAYAVDGLVAMARAAMCPGADASTRTPTKVIVRVDHTALVRGHVEPGETCDIADVGPIPVAEVRSLFDSNDPFVAVVGTDRKGRITTVSHLGRRKVVTVAALLDHLVEHGHDVTVARTSRRPDVYQRTALDWTTPTCSVVGCDQPRREIDHRDDWALTHHTVLHELDPYCKFHHYLKGHKGYRLESGNGRRRMLPPGPDPPAPP